MGIEKDLFQYADDIGPLKIIHVYEPSIRLKAILVVDNVARGPSIGGLRLAPDVSVEECFRLARAMTLKNAAADLRHGGGKSVMFGDPNMPKSEKEELIRCFAKAPVIGLWSACTVIKNTFLDQTWGQTRNAWHG